MHAKEASMKMSRESRSYDAPDWGFPMSYERPSFLEPATSTTAPKINKVVTTPKTKAETKTKKPKIEPFHEVKSNTIDIHHVLDEAPDINQNELKPEKW